MSYLKNIIKALFEDEVDSDNSFTLPEITQDNSNKLMPEDLLKNKNVYPLKEGDIVSFFRCKFRIYEC